MPIFLSKFPSFKSYFLSEGNEEKCIICVIHCVKEGHQTRFETVKTPGSAQCLVFAFIPQNCKFLHFVCTTTTQTRAVRVIIKPAVTDFFPVATKEVNQSSTTQNVSFPQLLVRPCCQLTNYFWFAHFTSAPTILDLQLGSSDKMALQIAHRNTS